MNRTDYQGMCQLFKDGQLLWVENTDKHVAGRVTGCGEGQIEVDVKGHTETWERSACFEMTHGYKMNYPEYMKHPQDFDTHLD
jgi:hypothetical protein